MSFGELFDLYGAGFDLVFNAYALFLIFAGVVLGLSFGAMPGLSSTMALALFTPLTFGFAASDAFVFLIAIYITSVYAGAITAVLVNIPGTPSSIATSLDGYPMAQRGEAGRAIGLATLSSFTGGVIGLSVLMLFSPFIAQVANEFGSWEYAMLALLALSLIAYVSPGSIVRGLMGGAIGLLLATVGQEEMMGFPRFTFGTAELVGGFHIVVLMIGLFGFAELFTQIEDRGRRSIVQRVGGIWRSAREFGRYWATVVRSALIGVAIGILPGAGGSIAAITAYGVAKRITRQPDEYGRGSPEGLSAAESSNNASVGGALVPMMTMGIPGDPMTAVLIGALMIHGLTPGPTLYAKSPELVSAIFLGFMVALFFMALLGLLAARPLARLVAFPRHYVLGVIALLCVIGSYSIQNSLFDVGIAIAAGFVGYLLSKVNIHPAPIILGLVLGPMLESNLRRAIFLADGSVLPFFTRPLSLGMFVAILAVLFGPWVARRLRR